MDYISMIYHFVKLFLRTAFFMGHKAGGEHSYFGK